MRKKTGDRRQKSVGFNYLFMQGWLKNIAEQEKKI